MAIDTTNVLTFRIEGSEPVPSSCKPHHNQISVIDWQGRRVGLRPAPLLSRLGEGEKAHIVAGMPSKQKVGRVADQQAPSLLIKNTKAGSITKRGGSDRARHARWRSGDAFRW